MSKKLVVVGAGLCGTLLALRLAQRGFEVDIYERRPDLRKTTISAGRSINLALSDRGLKALSLVGLEREVEALTIPMMGRRIHPIQGTSHFMPYSGREQEWINSISRGGLNHVLLDAAEATGKVRIHFQTACSEADLVGGGIQVTSLTDGATRLIFADAFFGTDGAGSAIREAMLASSARLRFNFSLSYLNTGYKELEIPAGPGNTFQLEKNALHIWPREGFMMIALPNLDGSFTVTLFMPMEGHPGFDQVQTDIEITTFFQTYFPEMILLMPHLTKDFHDNPTSSLGTVKCYPWQAGGKFLLMGDAAHAIVPFYGQGMNASFEDVFVMDALIEKHGSDWSVVFDAFQQARKPNADAIADLAVENETEMRSATADPVFQVKRQIELQLEQRFPGYFSKYSLVTFREELSYHEAMVRGRQQDQLLMELARKAGHVDAVNLDEVMRMMQALP